MHRSLTVVCFAMLVLSARAQPCAAVRFQMAAEGAFGPFRPRLTKAGLEPLPDGSFTKHDYYWLGTGLSSDTIEVGETTPSFEQEMYRCSGFPASVHRPRAVGDISADRPGLGTANYTLADLTGDGRTSLAVIERRIAANAVIVAIGTPSFELSGDFVAYPTGVNPNGVLAADFNNDGARDLAVIYEGPFDRSAPGGVSLLLNNGDGTFAAARQTSLGAFLVAAAAGDWDGDGRLDLAVSQSQPSSTVLLRGAGDGGFQAPEQIHDQAPVNLISGDVTGDGRLDLVASTGDGFGYFAGTAGGALGPFVAVDLGLVGAYSIELGDFNGDGRPDVAQGSLTGQFVAIALGGAGDGFGEPRRYLAGRDPIDLHAMDFDGDGFEDVVIAGGHPARLGLNLEGRQIAVLRGRGDGTFLGAQVIGGDQPSDVAAGDFNGDGADDLAIAARGPLEIWLSDGAGLFAAPRVISIAGASRVEAVSAADLNGDGFDDVIAADGGRVVALVSRGDGSFAAPSTQTAPAQAGFTAVGDFDGNGRPDVVVAGPNAASVFLSNADGSLQAGRAIALPAPFDTAAASAGDFNGDDRDDLAIADAGEFLNRAGKVSVFLATGGGAFGAPANLTAGINPAGVLATDLDQDGRLDLAVSTGGENFSEFVAMLRGDGAGGFAEPELRPTDFGPGEMAHTDLDGDGRADLLVMHCCGETDPTFLLGSGAGEYQPEAAFFGGASPSALAVGDFNRDGMPDLAILSNSNPPSGVSILINAATPASGPVHVSAASFAAGPLAPDMLVTAFGTGFANAQAEAVATPLPTVLAGTRIAVTDSAGARSEAGLIFMSPGQANYHIPPGVAEGPARVAVEPESGPALDAAVEIGRIAPGLFFLNPDRLAAATILRVTASGDRVVEQVYEVDAQGAVQPLPIDFGAEGDRIFLVAFGTGFRGRSSLEQARLFVDGIEHALAYAGEQGAFLGLDQANAELSRELAGRGDVDVRLEVEDKVSNVVRLRFR